VPADASGYLPIGLLRAFIETADSFEGKRLLLTEIEACVDARLKTLEPSWSLRGLWQLLVKRSPFIGSMECFAGCRLD